MTISKIRFGTLIGLLLLLALAWAAPAAAQYGGRVVTPQGEYESLSEAIAKEHFEEAAEIRDKIQACKEAIEAESRKTSS